MASASFDRGANSRWIVSMVRPLTTKWMATLTDDDREIPASGASSMQKPTFLLQPTQPPVFGPPKPNLGTALQGPSGVVVNPKPKARSLARHRWPPATQRCVPVALSPGILSGLGLMLLRVPLMYEIPAYL